MGLIRIYIQFSQSFVNMFLSMKVCVCALSATCMTDNYHLLFDSMCAAAAVTLISVVCSATVFCLLIL